MREEIKIKWNVADATATVTETATSVSASSGDDCKMLLTGRRRGRV